MAAGCGRGERRRVLAAGVLQAVVGGWLPAGLVVEARLEGHPTLDEPVEVLDAARAVSVDLGGVGAGTYRGGEEGVHAVRGVVETAGLLHRGPPAEVDQTAGKCGRPAPAAGALQYQHVRSALGRGDGRAHARDTKAGDHHIGLVIPAFDGIHRAGRESSVHRSMMLPPSTIRV